jgi:uncharacterized protein YukE
VALDPPTEVVQFLNFIGIDWPQVNEDHVRELATHVRTFIGNVGDTHQDATGTISKMSQAYQGSSYEALVQRWTDLSSQHLTELTDGCHVLATALDAAADFIVAQKGVAIGELVAMAAAFVADQAAAVATLGLAEAALVAIEAAGRKLCQFLEDQLTQYIIGKVIDAAITPLISVIEKAVEGFTFQAASAAAGAASAVGESFMMDPDVLRQHASELLTHADTMNQHAETFSSQISSLSFQ